MTERVYPPTIKFQNPMMAMSSAVPPGRPASPTRICSAATTIQKRPRRASRTTIVVPAVEAVEVAGPLGTNTDPWWLGRGDAQRGQGPPLMAGHPQVGQRSTSTTWLLE